MAHYALPVATTSAAAALLLARLAPGVVASVTPAFFALAAAQYAALAVYNMLVYPFLLSPLRHLPQPAGGSWLMGQFWTIAAEPTGHPHARWIRELHTPDGVLYYRGMWNTGRVMLTSAATLQEVLYQKSYIFVKPKMMRGGFARLLGLKGLLFAEGDVHRQQRKVLLPAFARGHIKELVPTFWNISRRLADKIREVAPGRVSEHGKLVNVQHWASLATLDIIGKAGFGYDFRALETNGQGSELAIAYGKIFEPVRRSNFMRIVELVLPAWLLLQIPSQRMKDIKQAQADIERVSFALIDQKRRDLLDEKDDHQRDILAVMLRSGAYDTSRDSQETLRDQMSTFLAAGHETTATALTWTLHLLTQNPAAQATLRDELRAAFPAGLPTDMTCEALEACKYLRHVCDESLRVYPPVPMTMREAEVDTTIAGHFVPAGTAVALSPWAINRDPATWGADADAFRPERWDDKGPESNYSFLTFLAGPRSCIGKEFSNLEMKALLAALVLSFEFTTTGEEVKIKGGLTARPEGGLFLWVKEIAA